MIKMILTDLDNTLLRNDKTISDYTLKTIQKLREAGYLFVPATARSINKLKEMHLFDTLPYDALILLNGSKILLNDKIIYHEGMPKQNFDAFLPTLLEKYGDHRLTIEIDETLYVNHNIWEVDPNETHYLQTKDFKNLPDGLIDRIIMEVAHKDEVLEIRKILPDDLYAHNVGDAPICRILPKNVTKAKAIDFLCQHFKINKDEIVAFGDDENDIEMFQYCHTSVAMANAIPSLQKIASAITLSNEQDGVAYWLEQCLLEKDSNKALASTRAFNKVRGWENLPIEDLAKSISIEAGELLECFQWHKKSVDINHVYEELADVLIYCIDMADTLNVSIEDIILKKLKKNNIKHPLP